MKVAVAGAGIAGLAIAHRLADAHDVTVFERAAGPGGKIRTERRDGYLFDWGPNGFLSNAESLRILVDELDLTGELVGAVPAAAARFIYRAGRLHRVPASPVQALATTLLSGRGKVRALGEVFVRRADRADDNHDDESFYAFVERRLGSEVAARAASPALLGITGGDAHTTSLDAVFPRLRALEREHGSLTRALLATMRRANRRAGDARPRLSTFNGGGIERLVARLAQRLGARLRNGFTVAGVSQNGDGWELRYTSAPNGTVTTETFDRVVLALPAYDAAELAGALDAALAAELRAISYAPMRVVGIAYRKEDLPAPLDGFGFLAARDSDVRILGAIYTSTIFPWQAPPGVAYLRVFLGGAVDPDSATLDSPSAQAIVRNDLRTTLGITAEAIEYHETLWPRAIPQYDLAHRARVRRIDARLAAFDGLALAGNAYRGPGLADTVADAFDVAAKVEAGR